MQGMTLSYDTLATEIYIVMRVFNMGQDDVGLRLYVDPATMEREGRLGFETGQYVVMPGATMQAAPELDPDEEL